MSAHESIFCLKRSGIELILGTPLPQGGFTVPGPEALLGLQQFFLPRPEAENDPRYKQLIPYQLFCCQGRYFVYQRGGGVGEGRLAGRLSIGIGGHINSTDSVGDQLTIEDYYAALHREREEELICPTRTCPPVAGGQCPKSSAKQHVSKSGQCWLFFAANRSSLRLPQLTANYCQFLRLKMEGQIEPNP